MSKVRWCDDVSYNNRFHSPPRVTFNALPACALHVPPQDMMHSDSHALATLLLIRDIQKTRNELKKIAERVGRQKASQGRGPHGTALSLMSGTYRDSRRWQGVTKSGRIEAEAAAVSLAKANECSIICEILDPRTQNTIKSNLTVAISSDFCQSNKLVSQVRVCTTLRCDPRCRMCDNPCVICALIR